MLQSCVYAAVLGLKGYKVDCVSGLGAYVDDVFIELF
jgi:hypothetical protein